MSGLSAKIFEKNPGITKEQFESKLVDALDLNDLKSDASYESMFNEITAETEVASQPTAMPEKLTEWVKDNADRADEIKKSTAETLAVSFTLCFLLLDPPFINSSPSPTPPPDYFSGAPQGDWHARERGRASRPLGEVPG